MQHRDAGRSVKRGSGRPPVGEALSALGPAVLARGPASDWTRVRLVLAALSVAVLAWGLVRTAGLLADEMRTERASSVERVGLPPAGEEGERSTAAVRVAGSGLRTDLFAAPARRRPERKREPKTNPVELLGLIELQGVIGGDRPRAMIQYRRTHETVTVSVGDDLGEFEVTDIRVRSVVLKWRDELFELSL